MRGMHAHSGACTHLVEGSLFGDLGDRLRVEDGVFGKGGGAHEMIDGLAIAGDAWLSIRAHDALACEAAHCYAQVALGVFAELALACTDGVSDLTCARQRRYLSVQLGSALHARRACLRMRSANRFCEVHKHCTSSAAHRSRPDSMVSHDLQAAHP
jgi:hypothetical protein